MSANTKIDSTAIIADLELRLAKAEGSLNALLELAAFFQDDYSLKLPVIASFRRWRGGHLSTESFLKRLGADDIAPVLRYEKVPPMEGLSLLNTHRQRR